MGVELKHIEIGDIPADWGVQTFEETFRILSNNTLSRDELNNRSGSVRNIHYGDILVRYSELLDCSKEDIPYITEASMLSSSTMLLQDGDIVIADTAEDNAVGKVTEIAGLGDGKLVAGLHTIPCRVKKGDFVSGWLGYYMNSHLFHDQILPFVTGIKVSSVAKGALSDLLILIPKHDEQIAIVTALSDVDETILELEKTISKKKSIKNGVMTKLFSEKKNWSKYMLKDIVASDGLIRGPFGGALKKEIFVQEGYKVYEQQNAINSSVELGRYYIDFLKYSELSRFAVNPGDFIVSCSGTIGKIFRIPENAPQGVINQALLKIKIDEKIFCADYFYQYFAWDKFQGKIIDDTQGGAMKNLIGMDKFREVLISAPQDINEQKEIAAILIDMDKDILEYEQKLKKYENIKQGMLAEFMSGKTRLV